MKVVEYFMSWQGEGRNIGERVFFVRLAGCNRTCSFCDTKNSWNENNPAHKEMTGEELFDIYSSLVDWQSGIPVCITGGEPLLQQTDKEFQEFIRIVFDYAIPISIETNGDILPNNYLLHKISRLTVSPKWEFFDEISEAQLDVYGEIETTSSAYEVDVDYKFLVDMDKSEEEIDNRLNNISIFVSAFDIPESYVWLMPITLENDSTSRILDKCKMLSEKAKLFRYNISLRLHLLLGFK